MMVSPYSVANTYSAAEVQQNFAVIFAAQHGIVNLQHSVQYFGGTAEASPADLRPTAAAD